MTWKMLMSFKNTVPRRETGGLRETDDVRFWTHRSASEATWQAVGNVGRRPWREVWITEAIDVRVFCIQMRADAMKMNEITKGEGSEGGEKRVKGRALGKACI